MSEEFHKFIQSSSLVSSKFAIHYVVNRTYPQFVLVKLHLFQVTFKFHLRLYVTGTRFAFLCFVVDKKVRGMSHPSPVVGGVAEWSLAGGLFL